jgi:tyrosyl-tRNA synthetase
VIYVVGSFTALIGDPTGRSKTRPPLTRAEIDANAETYKQQVFKLLHPTTTVVDFNSRWLGALTSDQWIQLCMRYSVAQMLERRDFRQRFEAREPISLHEFMYPLSQGYDSVATKADVELGGTDQLFNLNVGRDIMPTWGLEAQVVMTVPLLVGLDGVDKMSKSLGNYVGIAEPANVMFGKLLSMSDDLMWMYYELLTDLTMPQIAELRDRVARGALHPKQAKVDLAKRIIADFHSVEDAEAAAQEFERVHVRHEAPEEVPEVQAEAGETLSRVLVRCQLASSGSDATRKIKQGAVKVNGERVTDFSWRPPAAGAYLIQVGPRAFVRLVVTA